MEVGLRAVLCEHSCVKAEGFLDQHVFMDIIRQTLGRFIKKCIELTCWEVVVWQWRLLGSGKDLVAEAMTMVRVRERERGTDSVMPRWRVQGRRKPALFLRDNLPTGATSEISENYLNPFRRICLII